ncbi:MAG: hypothetical protein GF388_09130, partial [Candidatus Aegiribacteria sp.]|nr:hypothetical protein [Candidatus Aegiribacteria sp.]MBD3295224.1 hypothetical protein [Candidatus Fermentibacteria bacterium]
MISLLLTAVIAAAGPAPLTIHDTAENTVTVENDRTTVYWHCPQLETYEHLPSDLDGYRADGCGIAGDVLLPEARIFLAIPPGTRPVLQVIPEGVRSAGRHTLAGVEVTDEGIDSYYRADEEDIPSEWGSLSST